MKLEHVPGMAAVVEKITNHLYHGQLGYMCGTDTKGVTHLEARFHDPGLASEVLRDCKYSLMYFESLSGEYIVRLEYQK